MELTRQMVISRFALGSSIAPLAFRAINSRWNSEDNVAARRDSSLTGVGISLFVVPSVVAFGVDFYTGALYLPQATAKDGDEPLSLSRYTFAEALVDEYVDSIWFDHFGFERTFRNDAVFERPVASLTELTNLIRYSARQGYSRA